MTAVASLTFSGCKSTTNCPYNYKDQQSVFNQSRSHLLSKNIFIKHFGP